MSPNVTRTGRRNHAEGSHDLRNVGLKTNLTNVPGSNSTGLARDLTLIATAEPRNRYANSALLVALPRAAATPGPGGLSTPAASRCLISTDPAPRESPDSATSTVCARCGREACWREPHPLLSHVTMVSTRFHEE